MTLAKLDVVDGIGTDRVSGEVVLLLADEMSWENPQAHADLLTEKLNRYLGFVESGELITSYPDAEGHAVRIDILLRCEPPASVVSSLESARKVANEYKCSITWRLLAA